MGKPYLNQPPTAAQAAYCAGDQDMFWQMHDTIFSNFSNGGTGGYSPLRLKAMAESLNLDANDFASCFDSGKYEERVLENGAYGRENGVNSTPSFLINGKLVVGAISFDQLQLEIESALAE